MSTRKKVAISADAFDEVARKLGQGQLMHVFGGSNPRDARSLDMVDIVLTRNADGEDVEAEDVHEYEDWLVDDLRAEAADLDVQRGDGQDGEPLKADYVKALRKRDRVGA
jgi:hypothetical protein